MKYYLVIGYQTIEKYEQYGSIQLFLNDIYLNEFQANSELFLDDILHNININKNTTLQNYVSSSKVKKVMYDNAVTKYDGREFFMPPQELLYYYTIYPSLDLSRKSNQNPVINDTNDEDVPIKDMKGIVKALEQTRVECLRKFQKKQSAKQQSEDDFKVTSSQPKALKIYEIDSRCFEKQKENKITLRVKGGPSNDSNGFMNKRNMISIFPVFLFPEKILYDNTVEKLFERAKKNFAKKYKMNSYPYYLPHNKHFTKPNKKNLIFEEDIPLQWPGSNMAKNKIATKEGVSWYMLLGQPIGGDEKLDFYVHRKHKIYSLHVDKKTPKGIWQLNLCFLQMLEKFKLAMFIKNWQM
jgi:hypothetical protein